MTRRRAALGDVSNMTKKSTSNGNLNKKTHDENHVLETGASEKEGKKVTVTRASALAAAKSSNGPSGGVQKLTRGNTSRSVLGAKDSNKRDGSSAEPAPVRRGSGSGAMGDKKRAAHAGAGAKSTRKATSTHVLHDEPAKRKAERIERAISAQPNGESDIVEIKNAGTTTSTREKENVKPAAASKKETAELEKENGVIDAVARSESPGAVDEVIDLDTEDLMDPLMAAEYVVEIFEHLKELEVQTLPNPDYMEHQEEIDWKMRGILVDWLIEVHARFRLLPETLFLAVNIVDRFLSAEVVALSRLQLVGATAMFIASKYEEVLSPHVANFSQLADEAFSDKEILDAERHVLATLNYDISYPNPMNFLRRISKADNYDVHTRTIGKYLLEISLVDHRFMAYRQSHVAAAAMYMARLMWNSGPWVSETRFLLDMYDKGIGLLTWFFFF